MSCTRHEFIRKAALGVAAAAALPGLTAFAAAPALTAPAGTAAATGFTYGLATYSFRKFNLDQVIEMAKRIGLTHLSLKDMHLPVKADAALVKPLAEKVRAAGLTPYAAGVIYMKSEAEVNQTFDFAKAAGLKMIVGVPNHDLLPLVNRKVKEHDIRLAIHNHGPGDKVYPSAQSVYDKIKDLDKRIGLCLDVGHVVRINLDPIKDVEKYAARIYDVHIKDVTGRTGDDKPLEIGRGVIDIPGILRALRKVNYQGVLALEYEINENDPLAGAAESVGYLKGVERMLG